MQLSDSDFCSRGIGFFGDIASLLPPLFVDGCRHCRRQFSLKFVMAVGGSPSSAVDTASPTDLRSFWKTVRIRGVDFEECVAVHSSHATGGELIWQIQPIHSKLYAVSFCMWYDPYDLHNNRRKQQVRMASELWCPELSSHCYRSARSRAFQEAYAVNQKPRKCRRLSMDERLVAAEGT